MRVITVRGKVEVINHNAGRGNLRVHNQHLLVYDTLTLSLSFKPYSTA